MWIGEPKGHGQVWLCYTKINPLIFITQILTLKHQTDVVYLCISFMFSPAFKTPCGCSINNMLRRRALVTLHSSHNYVFCNNKVSPAEGGQVFALGFNTLLIVVTNIVLKKLFN